MWRAVARHELRTLRADGTLWWIALVFLVALVAGVLAGEAWRRGLEQRASDAIEDERDRYRAIDAQVQRYAKDVAARAALNAAGGSPKGGEPRDPRTPTVIGGRQGARAAILPAQPLAVLSIGQSDLLPAVLRVSTDAREQVLTSSEIENPRRLLEGRFDSTFVVVYLLPLLVLVLSYNMLSGEQEQGTLALIASQPVALSRVLLVKAGVRLLVCLSALLAAATVALLLVGLPLGRSGDMARLGLWVTGVSLYATFWLSLAIWLGARARSSAAAAMTLTGTWIVLTLVWPALANLAVNAWYPVPSRVEMVQAVRDASDAANAKGSQLLAAFYQDHPELAAGSVDAAIADFNVTRVAVAAEVERQVAPVIARYDTQLARQRAAVAWLALTSPAMLLRTLCDDVAGTGAARHARFVQQVAAFHDQWRAYFTPRIVQRVTLRDLNEVPVFGFVDETALDVGVRALPALGVLCVTTCLCLSLGLARIRRYRVADSQS